MRVAAPTHLGTQLTTFTARPVFSTAEFTRHLDPLYDGYASFGAFSDGRLVSFASGKFAREEWYLQLIFSSTEKISRINGIDLCLCELIKIAERRQIWRYWYSIPLRYRNAHNRVWSSSQELLASYSREDHLMVPKYTVCPSPRLLENVMSNLVLPVDMLIKRVTKCIR